MDLFEAHAKGWPLVIDAGDGGERLMAEVFPTSDGIVFADIGWPDASSHPFHKIEGQVETIEDGWRIGDHEVRMAFRGESLFEDWQIWKAWRGGEGSPFDRAACRDEIKIDLPSTALL